MDKINNVSFTGISNIGSIVYQRNQKSISQGLSMVLRDDFNGKDLAEFKSVIGKVADKSKNFKNANDPNVLHVECRTDVNHFDEIFLNGKKLDVNRENLPVFTYLAKVTRRILGMSDKEMVVNQSYKEFEAVNNLVYNGKNLVPENKKMIEENVDQFFDKNTVRKGAKTTNDFIQDLMMKFLGM